MRTSHSAESPDAVEPIARDGANDHPGEHAMNQPDQEPEAIPLTPELREWILKHLDEERALAELQVLREKGGQEFQEFVHELEQIVANDAAQAEMRANYPYFKQAVYASLREQLERDLAPLPEKDLEAVAREEGAQPLEAFIGELERDRR
jgi:hypothetical protein